MKASFLLLAAAALSLMTLTAVVGLTVDGTDGFVRHFLLGVMTVLFTCFVHVLAYGFFVVQTKIARQAVETFGSSAGLAEDVLALKHRVMRLSGAGIAAILATVFLGAAVETHVPSSIHMVAAIGTIALTAVVFSRQFTLIQQCGWTFHRAFGEH